VSAGTFALAAGFVNPALLGGVGLVLAPILIHLLSRRYYRRVAWGATRFLLEAEKETRRRVRFEQLLLVALRCLAMALVALVLARPFVQPGLVASLLGSQTQALRIVVLDDSASLGYRSTGATDFSTLREAAGRLLAWLHRDSSADPVTVFRTSDPDSPLASGMLNDAEIADLRSRLDGLEAGNLPARPRAIMQRIADDLAKAGQQVRADVFLLSDFQRSEWLAQAAAEASVFGPLAALPAGSVRLVFIATPTSHRDNLAIVDLRPQRPQTVAGLPAVLDVRLSSYLRQPSGDLRLEIDIDGATLPAVTIDGLRPGEARTVPVEVTLAEEGARAVTVSVAAHDAFPIDDARRIALNARAALSVLLVNGQPAAESIRDEVFLLASALAPPGPFSSGIRVQTADPSELDAADLRTIDCVMLGNVASLPEVSVAVLERYVSQGGGLAIFLGSEIVTTSEFNRTFHRDGRGLAPLALAEPRDADPPGGVGLVREHEHPLTSMFASGGEMLSEQVHFRRYFRCLPLSDAPPAATAPAPGGDGAAGEPRNEPAAVLATYTDSERTPAIAERSFGAGRVVLMNSTADLDWNDWARAPDGSYVVTMLELVQYLSRRERSYSTFVAGEQLSVALSPDEYAPGVLFRSPAYPDEPAVEGRAGHASSAARVEWLGPRAMRIGTYVAEMTRRGAGVESRPLCVNVDPVESELIVARQSELAAAAGPVPSEYLAVDDGFLAEERPSRRELWRPLLTLLVILLMAEQALAWWFGTPRRARASGGPAWSPSIT
jgi:hypothetical protein